MEQITLSAAECPDFEGITLNVGTFLGWDGRLWAIITPVGQLTLREKPYLWAANKVRQFMMREPMEIAWFRYHPPAGLLDGELETMSLEWDAAVGQYTQAHSDAPASEVLTWLKSMGVIESTDFVATDGPKDNGAGLGRLA